MSPRSQLPADRFSADQLLLPVSHSFDRDVFDLEAYETFIDAATRRRDYQAAAVRAALRFLCGGRYQDAEHLAREAYAQSADLQRLYPSADGLVGRLPLPKILSCSLDLATGTGKSYVLYMLARIKLNEGLIDRVLVLCPSLTIEAGLLEKFEALNADSDLTELLPVRPSGHPVAAGLVADNMASELERQTRYQDAVVWGERALSTFRVAGESYHEYVASRNLARHLNNVGRTVEATQSARQALEYLRTLRRSEFDAAHYESYAKRVEGIEQATSEAFSSEAGGLGWLSIGALAMAGEESLNRGLAALEQGRLSEAVSALRESRGHWVQLQAWHVLVRVDYHLAVALAEYGDRAAALNLAHQARSLAHELGDADREAMALSLLIGLRGDDRATDPWDYIVQAELSRNSTALHASTKSRG